MSHHHHHQQQQQQLERHKSEMYDDSMEQQAVILPESIYEPIAGQQVAGIVFPAVKNHNNYALDPYVHEPPDGSGDSASDLLSRSFGSGGGFSRMEPPPGTTSLHYPIDGELPQPNGLNVRAEEIGLVLLVLLLWVGAVALFFNRWGKIRMLEPYQPKFIDVPRASLAVPLVGVTGTVPINGATPMMTSHHQQQARPSYPLIEYVNTGAVHQARHQQQLLLHHQLLHSSRLNMNNMDSARSPNCCTSSTAAAAEVQVEVCHHQQQQQQQQQQQLTTGGSSDRCYCSNNVPSSSSSLMGYHRGRRASASPSALSYNLSPAPPHGVLTSSNNINKSINAAASAGCCSYCDCCSTASASNYRQMTSRPRQNSVVVFATSHFTTAARRAKSAMDLQTLVLREETEENVHALAAAVSAASSQQQSPLIGAITCV